MPHYKHFSAWQKLPWQSNADIKNIDSLDGKDWDPRKFPNIVFPIVDALGKCENYTHGDGYLQYGVPATPPQYQIASNIATAFDPTSQYKSGDLVYFNGKLF